MDNIYFMSGLPRSGSTLLLNLLGQNPAHHVTPTSGVIELFCAIKNRWKDCVEFKSQGLDVVKPKIENTMKGVLYGFFSEELVAGKVCFDKSRGWLQYIEDLERCLKRKVQVIITVRDIRAIVASFEKLYRNRGIEYQYPAESAFFRAQTTEGRAEVLLQNNNVIGITINRIRDALIRVPDRLRIVPYHHFTNQPRKVMAGLHKALDLPAFEYDPDNVPQITKEMDEWHGLKLHTIHPQIKPQKDKPWEGILHPDYAESLVKRYKDIQELLG